jgi:hypothetical protein
MEKKYFINVKHVDNRMVIFLNGETIWDSGIVHNDPEMNKLIDITEQLQLHSGHTSELIFEGFNDDFLPGNHQSDEINPWHFHYRVIERSFDEHGTFENEIDLLEPYDQKHYSKPNIRAMNNSYQIVKKEDGFKVVSNSLSQQFAQ